MSGIGTWGRESRIENGVRDRIRKAETEQKLRTSLDSKTVSALRVPNLRNRRVSAEDGPAGRRAAAFACAPFGRSLNGRTR
ncbi:hypothetical protein EVAR_10530_1 [Eumeta japonica]|uniref:Uncharacterized protein n=1 Tax=Eumeta variegata TaxID=151549 RepID=A0A4C1TIS1_EUMVA|nr:hypothetical protein EVAR_10530_1 [Eumeta japonica]